MPPPERPPAEGPFTHLFEGTSAGSAFEPLRRTRERIESILQVVVGQGGVLVQDFSGRIAYANAPAARLLTGTVAVASGPEAGTTFTVRLPRG